MGCRQMFRSFLVLAGLCLAAVAAPIRVAWTPNVLRVSDPRVPGGAVEILYLEAFCRPGGHDRDWGETRVPHRTELVSSSPGGKVLRFHTTVGTNIHVWHDVTAGRDSVAMDFRFENRGKEAWDVEWFQPACIRVDRFTGCGQSNYTARSFVFTAGGRTALDATRRTTRARYPGGQVYLPPWVRPEDANPRPLALDRLANGIIGCTSGDSKWLLAVASDRTFELFEGVYVCLHSDPWIGGLRPGEKKTVRQILYLVPNDVPALLKRYRRDFPARPDGRW